MKIMKNQKIEKINYKSKKNLKIIELNIGEEVDERIKLQKEEAERIRLQKEEAERIRLQKEEERIRLQRNETQKKEKMFSSLLAVLALKKMLRI